MKKYSKEEVALIQLESAIELFWQEKYVPAITLAGAAEEIYAVLLRKHSKKIGIPLPTQAKLEEGMFAALLGVDRIENYSADRNFTRNELKHHGKKDNVDFLEADFKQEAMNHIAGAVINCKMRIGAIPESEIVIVHCRKVGLS